MLDTLPSDVRSTPGKGCPYQDDAFWSATAVTHMATSAIAATARELREGGEDMSRGATGRDLTA
jgi:hypothetical protein